MFVQSACFCKYLPRKRPLVWLKANDTSSSSHLKCHQAEKSKLTLPCSLPGGGGADPLDLIEGSPVLWLLAGFGHRSPTGNKREGGESGQEGLRLALSLQ